MIFSKRDLQHLKRHLLIFLPALCVGGTAIIVSHNFAAHAQVEQQVAQHQLDTARANLASAQEDRKNMNEYMLEYEKLLARNIIGEGRRLDWIEGMEKIRQQHRILGFSYTISPRHPYTPPSKADNGRFDLSMSDMALQLNLLHEEQLLDFFDTLQSDTRGWFILNSCTMERVADADAAPGLNAVCTGGWLTLTNRGAT